MAWMSKARCSVFYSLLFVFIVCESFIAFGKPSNLQIAESDNPREVLKKTLSASRSVKSYRIRIEVPSFTKDVTIMEYAFPDRARIFGKNEELIWIGKDTYHKRNGDGPWKKYTEKNSDVSMTNLPATALENHIKSLAEAIDINFISQETVDGIPTLAYQIMHSGIKSNTEKAWFGVADGLLRRWELECAITSSTRSPVIHTYYDYNDDIKIEPPTEYVSIPESQLQRKREELVITGLRRGVPVLPSSILGTGVSTGSRSGMGVGAGIGPGSGSGYNMGGGNPDGSAKSVDSKPLLLNNPRPNYTEDARNNKIQGVVHVRVLVGTDGLVKQVKVMRGLPDGLTDEAIIAAKRMRFKPAMKNGQPVAYWQRVEIEFKF